MPKRKAELIGATKVPLYTILPRSDLLDTRLTIKPSVQYWILALFLLTLFATGGSARTDVQSLVILRPISIFVCAIALMTLRREHLEGRGWVLALAGATFLLILLHLIPLPPAMWQSLAGRQDIVDIEKFGGLPNTWRPLTLAPTSGWDSIVSLFAPLAVILLGMQLTREGLFRLLPLVVGLGTLSGLLGLLQVIGDPKGPLYFYGITNNGSAVGLFANRNHAATLLAWLFPMLAIFVSAAKDELDTARMRRLIASAIAIVLVPLILVTGSRSGLVSATIGIAAATILYRQPAAARIRRDGKPDQFKTFAILGMFGIISVAFLTYFLSRAEAIERLFVKASGGDNRSDFWAVSIDLLGKYLSWGSGSGSFGNAYRVLEPARLLDPTYLNRAHNDWIETAVTFGIPGTIISLVVLIGFGVRSHRVWRGADGTKRAVQFGRLASVMIAMIAIASAADYPLRTPTMMGIFALCVLWLVEAGQKRPVRRSRP